MSKTEDQRRGFSFENGKPLRGGSGETRRPLVGVFLAAIGLLAVLEGCQTPGAPIRNSVVGPPTDQMAPNVFQMAARELIAPLDHDLRLAVRPIRTGESAVPSNIAKRVEENLVTALRSQGRRSLTILTRSELGKLVEDIDPFDARAIEAVQANTRADALLVSNAHAIANGLSLSFAVYDLRPDNLGEIIAATSGHFLPIDLEKTQQTTTSIAVRKSAVALAEKILDDEIMLASNVRFASEPSDDGVAAWLSSRLVNDLDEVLPELRKKRWAPVGNRKSGTKLLRIEAETWDQGSQFQVRFQVLRDGGESVAEQTAFIASKSIPFPVLAERAGGLEASDAAPASIRRLNLAFAKGRSTLSAADRRALDHLGERYGENGAVRFRIDGHASYAGGTQDPAMTAQLRASTVQAILMRAGVPARQIWMRTFPHPGPGADHDTVTVTYGLDLE